MKFIDELKRRNVLRAGAAYIVTAWLVIQVVDTILPAFGFGDVAVRFVTISFAIGFIPVLIVAWAYELTPEGLKKDGEVSQEGASREGSTRKFDRAIMVILAIAVGYFAFDKFVLAPERESSAVTAAGSSIAVLPFINRSASQDDAYFADGMHDELLNRLAKISALEVISRTSVMRYRNSQKTFDEIADELSVATLLEAGVQRVGNQVRVNVQLIDASSEKLLWTEAYDRQLTAENLFKIQSEISNAIASALHAELTPETEAMLADVPTRNAEAYDLYLQAVQQRYAESGPDSTDKVKALLLQSVALDPDFLDAQVLLAQAYGRMYWHGVQDGVAYSEKALELVTDIRRRWPDRIEGHIALAGYHYTVERDYSAALAEYQKVEKVYPNSVDVLMGLLTSYKRLDRNEEFLEYARRVVRLDPENSIAAGELLIALSRNGLGEEAVELAMLGVSKFPEDNSWGSSLAQYRLLHFGDVDSYLEYGDGLRAEGRWTWIGSDYTWHLYGRGEVDKALEHTAVRLADGIHWYSVIAATDRAMILQLEGDTEQAKALLDETVSYLKSEVRAGRFLNSDARSWSIHAAYCAAVAGDLDAVAEFRARADAAPLVEIGIEKFNVMRQAQTDALIGNAEGGWARIEAAFKETNPPTTAEFLAVHPYYNRLFGELPAFQEFIANANVAD